ncbi:MAG: SH3 domain-containing protein, partial [Gemmatimonadota bacterium]
MRKSGVLAALLLLVLGSGSPLAAQLPTRYAAKDLRVRAEDAEDSRVLFSLPAGASVQLRKCRGDWCQISYEGRIGWA